MHIGKFERKIVLALLVTAAAPLLCTWFIVDRLVEESMAVGLNKRVIANLRDGVELYNEVIVSRTRIARLVGENLAKSPSFNSAVQRGEWKQVQSIFQDIVTHTPGINRIRFLHNNEALVEVTYPREFSPSKWKSKSVQWEINNAEQLEFTFGIEKDFLDSSYQLRELVQTLETVEKDFQPWKMGYYRLFLFIYVGILLAAVVLGFLLARRVTRRVGALARATKQAAQGDLDIRVPVHSNDEIGLLAKSFNAMMNDLKYGRDRIVYLEKISSWQEIARRLAHEIKNSLTPIQLAVQELHRTYPGKDPGFLSKLNYSLEIVEEEVGTLRLMMETFAEFAKMPAANPVLDDLNEFVSGFLKVSPQYVGRVNFHPTRTRVLVRLDRVLMGRVLNNLLKNALEASEKFTKVEIHVEQTARWGVMRIIDHGHGLSNEAKAHLFQPYFTTKPSGTGLGLVISKKIVLQHKGEIFVQTGSNNGTVFVVRLQIAR